MSPETREIEVKVLQKMPAGFRWDDVKGATRVIEEQHAQLLSRIGTISREIEKIREEEEKLQEQLDKLKELEATAETVQQKTILDVINQYQDRTKALDEVRQVLYKVVDESGATVAAIVNTLSTKLGKPTADKKLNKALEVLASYPDVLKVVTQALDDYTAAYQSDHKTVTEVIALVSKDWAQKTDKQLGVERQAKEVEARKRAEIDFGNYDEELRGRSILPFLHECGLLHNEYVPMLMESVWHSIVQMATKVKESIQKVIGNLLGAKDAVQQYINDLSDVRKELAKV